MFCAGIVFVAIGVITALFGFGVISDEAPLAPKLFSGFFLCAAAASFWWGWMTRLRQPTDWHRRVWKREEPDSAGHLL
jgi:uncharacterized membrane protein YfcA